MASPLFPWTQKSLQAEALAHRTNSYEGIYGPVPGAKPNYFSLNQAPAARGAELGRKRLLDQLQELRRRGPSSRVPPRPEEGARHAYEVRAAIAFSQLPDKLRYTLMHQKKAPPVPLGWKMYEDGTYGPPPPQRAFPPHLYPPGKQHRA